MNTICIVIDNRSGQFRAPSYLSPQPMQDARKALAVFSLGGGDWGAWEGKGDLLMLTLLYAYQ